MGAVDDDPQAVEAVRQAWPAAGRRTGRWRPASRRTRPTRGAGRPLPRLAHAALDRVLDVVGQLVAALGEELDPVVRHGVVRRREHDAEVGAGVGDQPGDGRRRQHAGVVDVDPGAGQAGDDGRGRGTPQRPAGHARRRRAAGARRTRRPRRARGRPPRRGRAPARRSPHGSPCPARRRCRRVVPPVLPMLRSRRGRPDVDPAIRGMAGRYTARASGSAGDARLPSGGTAHRPPRRTTAPGRTRRSGRRDVGPSSWQPRVSACCTAAPCGPS